MFMFMVDFFVVRRGGYEVELINSVFNVGFYLLEF